MLSKKQLVDICMYHKGAGECRYLHQDDSDYTKCYCLKLRPEQKKKIDDGVSNFFKECQKKSLDPYAQNEPIGDNCPGYLFLKHVEQGYDKGN